MDGNGLRIQVTNETKVLDLLDEVENIAKPEIKVNEYSDGKVKVVNVEEIDYDSILENAIDYEDIPAKGR